MTPVNGSPDGPRRSKAIDVAVEHVLWAAAQDFTPGEVLTAIGVDWSNLSVTSETVIAALALVWRKLKKG